MSTHKNPKSIRKSKRSTTHKKPGTRPHGEWRHYVHMVGLFCWCIEQGVMPKVNSPFHDLARELVRRGL